MKDHDEVIYIGKNKYDWYEILLIDSENSRKIKLQFLSNIDALKVMNTITECSPFCIEIMRKGR